MCPATAVLAESYSANALPYLDAMKKADPQARIGVPWAFTGNEAKGAGTNDAAGWDDAVLHALGGDIDFVDAHWYPFDTTAGYTDQEFLGSVAKIPAAAARIRSALRRYARGAAFVVGEMNISERETTLDFQPVSALFAAATSLEWLSQGAQSVDWWDLNNFGSPSTGDYGLVSSGGLEARPAGTPLPPYYGEELAGQLASPGSHLETVATGSSTLLGFESDLRQERHVLLVNTDSSSSASIATNWFTRGSNLHVDTYSASSATDPSPIAGSMVASGGRVVLPAQSIVVISGAPRS